MGKEVTTPESPDPVSVSAMSSASSDAPSIQDASPSSGAPLSRRKSSSNRRIRSLQERLGSIVLGFEIIVLFLATLVVWGLSRTPSNVTVPVRPSPYPDWLPLMFGGALIVIAIIAIGLLRKKIGVILGWSLQIVIIVAGFVNPALFVVGAIFGGLWAYCMIVSGRLDRRSAR